MTLEQNIMAILETNFTETKDEIKERVLKLIITLIENSNEKQS